MERLATMMASIEKRLTLQENERNVANQESKLMTVDVVHDRTSMLDAPLKMESRPRTWPDQTTPPQTRRKTIQPAGDPAELIDNINDTDAGKQIKHV